MAHNLQYDRIYLKFLGIVDDILKKSRNFPCNSTVHKYIEIYKGNSEKYKGKIKNQDISIFGHTNIFVGYLRCLAAFLRSIRFFWHLYWHTYIWCMSEHHTCHICHLWHIWHLWHLWHLAFDMHTYVNMGVKRSVRTSGMQPIILNILHKYL